MANRKWKIIETKGGLVGKDLDGCLIEETANGFEFKDKEKRTLSGTGRLQPTLPFEFPEFIFEGHNWKITVTGLELGQKKEAAGEWRTGSELGAEEDGGWTAQAGGGPVDEEAEADETSGQACSQ